MSSWPAAPPHARAACESRGRPNDPRGSRPVGVWPLVSTRQDMGRTIRGGPAHKIKACTTLLERAVVQQAKSSLSWRCELNTSQHTPSEHSDRDALVHQEPQGGRQRTAVPVRQRLDRNRDTRNTLDAHRRTYDDSREGASHGYHPRHGRRYDNSEDQSPSPGLPGPQAFGRHILNAASPPR